MWDVIFGGFGGKPALLTFSGRKLRKRMRRVVPHALANAPEGVPVRVKGVIRALDPGLPITRRFGWAIGTGKLHETPVGEPAGADPLLVAPLSERPCVYHASFADLDIVNGLTMKPHVRATGITRFVLDDGEHRAIIDPAHVIVSARFDHETRSKAAFDAEPRQRYLLDKAPVESWFNVRGVCYYEAILEVGQQIEVLGAGTRELAPGGELGYRETATRMCFAGTAKHPLVICDHPDQL